TLLPRPPPTPLFPYTTLFRSLSTQHHQHQARLIRSNRVSRPAHASAVECIEIRLSLPLHPAFSFVELMHLAQRMVCLLYQRYLRSEEQTSELQSRENLVCRLL